VSEPLPRLLLVEDEPVVRAFLVAALDGLPLRLDLAANAAEAGRLARAHAPALVLLDLNLPDGDGVGTLAALRADGVGCPVVALTADVQARLEGRLAAAGFAGVAHKPLGREALRQLVGQWLGGMLRSQPWAAPTEKQGRAGVLAGVAEPGIAPAGAAGELLPDWDDDAALAALAGRAEILEVLRGLLRADLPGQLATIESTHASDPALARGVLHRLQAAAAFCGAARLAASARALETALLQDAAAGDRLRALRDACATVLAATPA
jgi:CheY-like chemotaxis protein